MPCKRRDLSFAWKTDKVNLMFGAIKQLNGLYTIAECWPYTSKTYNIRAKLKLFGRWNLKTKKWEDIKEKDLPKIPASKQIKVRVEKYCHTDEKDVYCFEHEIKDGYLRVSCLYCDSFGMSTKVLKTY